MTTVLVSVNTIDAAGRSLIAPIGMHTPHQTFLSLASSAERTVLTQEASTGQSVLVVPPEGYAGSERIELVYSFAEGGNAYPDTIFAPRQTRFTRAADALVRHVGELVANSDSELETIKRIIAHTAETFTYGHPAQRYYDGCEEIPLLGCGMTAGSCVDINMYLIAALRSVGIEAGYVAGPFYPAEKGGRCDDMHCWVVTRHGARREHVLEWDIAHHLKLGTRTVAPGLNPKPGWRAAVSHSMGWDLPLLGVQALKLLSEPMWVDEAGTASYATLSIASQGALAAA
jgi:hypothetical protein